MTLHAFLHIAGKSTARRIGFLLVATLVLSGCSKDAHLFAVKAVATGVPSLAPFFDERSGLGHDASVRARQAPGGLQAGNTPGLYGGSRKPTVCDVERLKEFLTDPKNGQKATVWAQVEGITEAEIPDYLDRLTPVLLRHDTLVRNHDYKKGRATPFNSLLQAGIAVLVDEQGQPTVKCSCGNPLRPFQGDSTRISVEFEDGNKKWPGYDRASVVTVRPAPRPLARLALVDVEDPDRGLDRPVGTTGGQDKPFDTQVRHKVPELAGMDYSPAVQRLVAEGLAVAYAGQGAPPDDAAVTGSDPGPGTELAFGQYVTLSVDRGDTNGPHGTTPGGTGAGTGGETAGGTKGGTSAPPTSSETRPGMTDAPAGSGAASSPPASNGSPPASGGRTPGAPYSPTASTRPPESSNAPPASSAPASTSAPGTTGAPSTGRPATSSAPISSAPVTGAPVTGRPTTSKPTSGKPATSAPGTSEPPVTRAPATGSPTAGTT